jgi:hypothetical protein
MMKNKKASLSQCFFVLCDPDERSFELFGGGFGAFVGILPTLKSHTRSERKRAN